MTRPQLVLVSIIMAASHAASQDLIIDNIDGTATTIPMVQPRSKPNAAKPETARFVPSIGQPRYLNIVVDMADLRFVDVLEDTQRVTDPGYVQELFRMMAGTGEYDGIVGSFKNDSYGAFAPEGDYMGVYASTLQIKPACDHDLFKNAAQEVWPQVKQDAAAQGVDLASYDGIVWWIPFYSSCPFAGFAYTAPVGGLFDHVYRVAFIAKPSAEVLQHEFGHTRGLRHLSCRDESGELIEYCEGGMMGSQKRYRDDYGDVHNSHSENLRKTAANNQYALGWTNPNGEPETASPSHEQVPWMVAPGDTPAATFLEVSRSGMYRISAHTGPACENQYPELLIIPSPEENKSWFISFEEGDGYNPDYNTHFTIEEQMERVTVRSQLQSPNSLENSIREALLGVGECATLENAVTVCTDGLLGHEEADISVRFHPQLRRSSGRRIPIQP